MIPVRSAETMRIRIVRDLMMLDDFLAIARDQFGDMVRARELVCDAASGGHAYGSTLADLDRYFLWFAIAAPRTR